MIRPIVVLLAGIVCGAAAVYVVSGGERNTAWQDPVSALAQQRAGTLERDEDRAGGEIPREAVAVDASSRLAAYRSAATVSDLAELTAALERAVSAPSSLARDIEIDALLSRLADLEPARAVQLARTLAPRPEFVADAFVAWAEADPEAALHALGGVETSANRRAAALAVMVVFGDDTRGFERIATALPEGDRASFQVDWLAHRAEYDPYGALSATLALSDMTIRRRAAQQVGAAWARQYPEAAMSLVSALPDNLQTAFRNGASSEWARLDPARFQAHLEFSADPMDVGAGVQWLLVSDPDAMLAWAANLAPPSPDAQRALAQVIAESDLDLALNLIAESSDDPTGLAMVSTVSTLMRQAVTRGNHESAFRIADWLLERETSGAGATLFSPLQNVLSNWLLEDQDQALEWIIANAADVDVGVMGNVARIMATAEGATAIDYADRLPPEFRTAWVAYAAGAHAQEDPAAAFEWIAQLRGQVGYDAALREVVTAAAQANPAAAAMMLTGASRDVEIAAAPVVVSRWVPKDPQAAAQWALGLANEDARAAAVAETAFMWAGSDPEAARHWTLNLPSDYMRDEALTGLLMRGVVFTGGASASIDDHLLDAFSSDLAREQGVGRLVPVIARTDPQLALALFDQYVTNPLLRERIDAQLGNIIN